MKRLVTDLFKKYPILRQLFRFGVIGSLAALVNMLVVIFLVEVFAMNPLIANVIAFLLAFNISYLGHCHWSFAEVATKHIISVPRFFIVATISLALYEGLYYVFLYIFHLHYILALFIVLLIVPLFTFFCSKLWAFKA